MPLIEIKNLEKIYKNGEIETPALRGVSFVIEKGEFVSIMGPSGSGKSTLLHILGFMAKLTRGQYYFAGRAVEDFSEQKLAQLRNQKIGFVFQDFNLLGRVSVLDNVKLPLLYSKIKEDLHNQMVQKAIEAVGLSHRLNYEASKLSGGEKQRVAIARAIVNNPLVILADEPTGNLDSKSGEMVMKILQRLNSQGQTIILVTHETYTAEYAQRVIKLKDGQVESDQLISHRRLVEKEGYYK